MSGTPRESRHPSPDCGCDPEAVFELADATLDGGREGEVRHHVIGCPGCRELYERELGLNALLGDLDPGVARSRSVCRGVAMALPTRAAKARILWAALAGVLLISAVLALSLDGTNPAVFAANTLGALWELVSGLAGVVWGIVAAAGPILVFALVAGAVVDLIIAVVLLRKRRRGANASGV